MIEFEAVGWFYGGRRRGWVWSWGVVVEGSFDKRFWVWRDVGDGVDGKGSSVHFWLLRLDYWGWDWDWGLFWWWDRFWADLDKFLWRCLSTNSCYFLGWRNRTWFLNFPRRWLRTDFNSFLRSRLRTNPPYPFRLNDRPIRGLVIFMNMWLHILSLRKSRRYRISIQLHGCYPFFIIPL